MKALPDINERALGRFDDPSEEEVRAAALYVAGRVVQEVPADADVVEAAKGAAGDELRELLQILGVVPTPAVSRRRKANGTAAKGES